MNQIVDHFRLFEGEKEIVLKNQNIIDALADLDYNDRQQLRERLLKDSLQIESKEEAIKWLKGCFEAIDKYQFRIHQVLFSPGTQISDTLIELLQNARKSVKLCVFSITDNTLAYEVIKCHRRGLDVKVITDDMKTFDKGSEIHSMSKRGIDIKIDHSQYHMHNKFGVIDDRIVFTGSFNWTYTASKHNQENLVVTSNHSIVEQFNEEFERLWNEMFSL